MNFRSWQPETESAPRRWETLFSYLEIILKTFVIAILCMIFFIRMVRVDGDSMLPTLHSGDLLLMTHVCYTPQAGDIVAITKPNSQGDNLIKRVIATEGQTIDIDFSKGVVYVDGKALEEPYLNTPTERWYDLSFPQTVPEGHVFVMGDNRNYSWDSRAAEIGMVDNRYILGKEAFCLLSPQSVAAFFRLD